MRDIKMSPEAMTIWDMAAAHTENTIVQLLESCLACVDPEIELNPANGACAILHLIKDIKSGKYKEK
jgi:hypothetical protein